MERSAKGGGQMSLLKNKLQKLEDAIQGMVETGETGLTGSTVLRHEIKPKMGDINKIKRL